MCRYVTAVGGTQGPEQRNGSPEVACQSFNQPTGVITSGGGFSEFYPTPSFQTDAVKNWSDTASNQSLGGYNVNGRGKIFHWNFNTHI